MALQNILKFSPKIIRLLSALYSKSNITCKLNTNTDVAEEKIKDHNKRHSTRMARVVDVWHGSKKCMTVRRTPLVIEKSMMFVLDTTGWTQFMNKPVEKSKALDEFIAKYNLLTVKERRSSFLISAKEFLNQLDQLIACIGCKKNVHRQYVHFSRVGHFAFYPLIVTPEGYLTISDDALNCPQFLYGMFRGNVDLVNLLKDNNQTPRNKRTFRCSAHSRKTINPKPDLSNWRGIWNRMESVCHDRVAQLEINDLNHTLNCYNMKYISCRECRAKVILASTYLTQDLNELEKTEEILDIMKEIKYCSVKKHFHLPTNLNSVEYIISKMGKEVAETDRHCSDMSFAQEDVIRCLGFWYANRLNCIKRRLKEEDVTSRVFCAVLVEALCRSFYTAVDEKQIATQEAKRQKAKLKEKKKKREKRRSQRIINNNNHKMDTKNNNNEEEDSEDNEEEETELLSVPVPETETQIVNDRFCCTDEVNNNPEYYNQNENEENQEKEIEVKETNIEDEYTERDKEFFGTFGIYMLKKFSKHPTLTEMFERKLYGDEELCIPEGVLLELQVWLNKVNKDIQQRRQQLKQRFEMLHKYVNPTY